MRTVRSVGELPLLARLGRRLRAGRDVRIGIGDDAAAVQLPRGSQLLLASDMLVEGVHFRRRRVPARWIGWKALACNLSDIAAMGGQPRWALVSLGLPRATPVRFVDALYAGLTRCARRYGVSVIGGDLVRAPRVVVDVAVAGTVRTGAAIQRSGARVGDHLFVTGRLGGSLRSGRHARFLPRVAEAQALRRRVRIHAMIDLSDGLASDLWQLSRASRVSLQVAADRIPVAGRNGSVYHALMDGEDFELLFAVASREAHRVPRRIGACPVTQIGTVTGRGAGVTLRTSDGRIRRLTPRAFRHF